jgi:hypothetical protein
MGVLYLYRAIDSCVVPQLPAAIHVWIKLIAQTIRPGSNVWQDRLFDGGSFAFAHVSEMLFSPRQRGETNGLNAPPRRVFV